MLKKIVTGLLAESDNTVLNSLASNLDFSL